ncbi:alpha/beta fold hydrolase [Nocardia sp. alder85J]|uniref:alpha/beta fold hydrolase n=1 Tax=Nocardia sp. alder85J TaxID=2862949 RepID=UPI001CD44A6D|nr:alpha/beta fold hydrolase [Nocardia sp. alder85J]MCX4095911.1 alpha/beta fold hydrolase [Nocardia sp. alder85J]
MPLSETDMKVTNGGPVRVTAKVNGVPMSGLLAVAPAPRAVVVALHGGGTTAAYFDCPGHTELSLLRVAPALGYTVLALDRPGYGASAVCPDRVTTPAERVELVFGAVDAHLAGLDRAAGVFLAAHSAASEIALRLAADPRGADLLGLEIGGAGREMRPEVLALLAGQSREGRRPRVPSDRLWIPERLYPPDILGGKPIGSPRPPHETDPAAYWSEDSYESLAARVRVPVRLTAGDHESVWRNDPEHLAATAALFRASTRTLVNIQPEAGHNLSIGYTARAYHLGLLGFVAECVAGVPLSLG